MLKKMKTPDEAFLNMDLAQHLKAAGFREHQKLELNKLISSPFHLEERLFETPESYKDKRQLTEEILSRLKVATLMHLFYNIPQTEL